MEQFHREAQPVREDATVSSELIVAYNVAWRFRTEECADSLSDEERDAELFDYDFKFVRTDKGAIPLVQVVMMPKTTNILQSAHRQGNRRLASFLVDLRTRTVVCWDNFGPVMRRVPGSDDCPKYRVANAD